MAAGRFPLDDFRFKSEAFVPIRQDTQSFEERQRRIWEDMHLRMERRRKEWDDEVNRLRSDFFRLRPDDDMPSIRSSLGGGDSLLSSIGAGPLSSLQALDRGPDPSRMFYDSSTSDGGTLASGDGGKMFRVSFDVSQFQPEEISVRTQDQHLIVHAKHEEQGGDKSLSREFSRQVDIPPSVDPLTLRSTLSKDGILQVEAPVAAPAYERIRNDVGTTSSIGSGLRSLGSGSTSAASLFDTPPLTNSAAVQPRATAAAATTSTPAVADSSVFRISVDIGADFEPGDLTVKTVDRKLIVHARHEEKAPGRSSCRQFNREFDLPENIDPQTVTASLGEDGRLIIEAPVPNTVRL